MAFKRDVASFSGLAVLCWLLGGLLTAFYSTALHEPFFDVEKNMFIGWLLFGLCILAGIIWAAIEGSRGKLTAIIVFAMIVSGGGVIAVWSTCVNYGDQVRFQWRFDRLKGQYKSIIAEAKRLPAPASETCRLTAGSIKYIVSAGPPVRVVFPQEGGILDNWEGIVYDPSGLLKRLVGTRPTFSQNEPDFPEARMLFGGYIMVCKDLGEDFYFCSFT